VSYEDYYCSFANLSFYTLILRLPLSLSLSAVKYGRSSVYEHFIHEDWLLRTTIICTIFQQRTSFHAYQENGLNTKYPKGRKRSFWRCFLLQNCFYVTIFTVFRFFLLKMIRTMTKYVDSSLGGKPPVHR